MSLETQFVQALSGLLYAAGTGAIAVVTPKVKEFIKTHTQEKTATVINNAIDGLSKVCESVVSDFNQRIVNDAKTKKSLTPELAEQVKIDAIEAVKSQGASFIKLLDKSAGDIEKLISTLIEQAVSKAKVQ